MDPKLIEWLASVSNDPYAYVMGAFPWGEADTTLEHFDGPDEWQADLLKRIRDGLISPQEAIQEAVASGHGVGKSTLIAWIIKWGADTFPDTRGVVTANTETQLKTKTWPELGKWHNISITRDHFTLTATAYMSKDPSRERTWRIDQVPWSEKNTEAFAGMHNKGKRLLLLMDEASAIPDVIWEVAEGALTDADTQIIWLAFGNPTRNIGRFKECFPGGRFAKYWHTTQVDSRSVKVTNKTQIARWIEAYGDDSDFVSMRIKGVFPKQGLMEFFIAAEIDAAMSREVTTSISDPLALGVDVARFGGNNSVIFPRKGRDARSIPRKVFNGLNTVELATRVQETATQLHADGIFIDGGGVGGGVVDNVRHMQLFCFEISFGGRDDIGGSPWGIQGERYANKRAAMYGALRAWIKTGAIPNDPDLKTAMLAIKYTYNKKDEILLEAKEDIMADNPNISLDDLDGLVLTFGQPLSPHAHAGGEHLQRPAVEFEYNPLSNDRMVA